MKQALPIFFVLALAGGAFLAKDLLAPHLGFAQPNLPVAAPATPAPAAAPVARKAEGVEPRQLLQRAFEAIDGYGSVSAKLRQRAELHGVAMIGSGTYIQGSTASHRLRLEMTFQLGTRKASVQQIADGEYLWTRRELASAPVLSRTNIDRVLEIQDQAVNKTALRNGYVLGLGGLPRVLLSMQRCFDFDTVAETTLGGMNMYLLRGVWNRTSLAHLLQDQTDAIRKGAAPNTTSLANQVPDEVVVFLGRDDLFPYRFEYRRTPASQVAYRGESPRLKTLMALEFYEVQVNESIDPQLFQYEPGEMGFDDDTNRYLFNYLVWPQ